jgi:MEMO1 family protein
MANHVQPGLRPSPIAGQWYEGNPDSLAKIVDEYIQQAKFNPPVGTPLAVISPHAGHVYSGPVAGYAFAAIQALHPEIVVVVSPLHQPARGSVFTSLHSAYWTPLGILPIATDLVTEIDQILQTQSEYRLTYIQNDREHSVEIELPFLQRIYHHPFQFVPLMVKDQDIQFVETMGKVLFEVLTGRNVMVVASTDLSHFYSQKEANRLDERMLDAIKRLSVRDMIDLDYREEGYACGLGATAAVIHYSLLAGADRAVILKHATSGDVTGDFSSVVGYGAAAILRTSE